MYIEEIADLCLIARTFGVFYNFKFLATVRNRAKSQIVFEYVNQAKRKIERPEMIRNGHLGRV